MATKQLGKLRQWAGEKISLEKKTEATDEFKDLEVEVERRRIGMNSEQDDCGTSRQVYEHSQIYHRYLMKKKDITDGFHGQIKLLPMESLGHVMIAHGEEFGPDSAYGHSLSALGSAHVKVAGLQEQFGEEFHSMFLTRLELQLTEVTQYYALRKKLKSRRLAYDAAVSSIQKPPKKDAEKTAAEDEAARARQRFEEISSEVQSQMERIQDGEMDQFKDLGRLLDMELKFAQSWVDTLQEIKSDWPDNHDVYRVTPNKPKGLTHALRPISPSQPPADEEPQQSDTSETATRPAKHQRSMSVATSGSQGRKSSVTNWASNAVGSIFKKEKSGNFESLEGDDRGGSEGSLSRSQSRPEAPTPPTALSRSRSGRVAPPPPRSRAQSTRSETTTSKHNSPRIPPRSLPDADKAVTPKMMRALYAFNGAKDELTMEVGDEITVISEPSDTWWMGECKGQKGLFPVTYTEEIPKKPPLPTRPPTLSKPGHSQPTSPVQNHPTLRTRSNSANLNKSLTADWGDEPFGDHHSALAPIAHSPDYRQMTHSGGEDDEDDRRGLVTGSAGVRDRDDAASTKAVVRQLTRSFSGKKAPPPPPVRRATSASLHKVNASTNNGTTNSPFLTPTTPNAKSWNNGNGAAKTGDTAAREHEESKSPFDEGDGDGYVGDEVSFSSFSLSHKCRDCSCDDFQQSLFKKDGMCNSCFHAHG